MNPLTHDEGNGKKWYFEREYYERTYEGLRDHEDRLRKLEKTKWELVGMAVGASAVFTLIARLLFR